MLASVAEGQTRPPSDYKENLTKRGVRLKSLTAERLPVNTATDYPAHIIQYFTEIG